MLLFYLLDRIFWPATTYSVFALIIYAQRDLLSTSLRFGLCGSAIFLCLKAIIEGVLREHRINRLGDRAPTLRNFTPFQLGYVFREAYYFFTHQYDVYWRSTFNVSNSKTFTTCESTVVGGRAVFTHDEENIKAMLATQFEDFGKGPGFRKSWEDFLGLSIFTTDGDLWHNSRALLRPQFIKERVSDLQILERHIEHLLPLIRGTKDNGNVQIDSLFLAYSLDAATDFLLGQSAGSLHNRDNKFAVAFNKVQHYQAIKVCLGDITMLATGKDFKKQLGIINEFINPIIDRALQLPLNPDTDEKRPQTFLHAIAQQTRDRKVLRDQLIAVLLAGRDTTALTLSWLFYELASNPRIVANLRREIANTLPRNDALPTYTDLKAMCYLQNTLKEILRLYPVVPYNVRVALKDTTLPRGGGKDGDQNVGVSKGTAVFYSTLVMQRREDIYPPPSAKFPHCSEFCPERWNGWTPKPWTYIPFNGGPRICIGQQFALTEMAYTVVRILQTFERVELRMDKAPAWRSDVVLHPHPGVTVAFSNHSGMAK